MPARAGINFSAAGPTGLRLTVIPVRSVMARGAFSACFVEQNLTQDWAIWIGLCCDSATTKNLTNHSFLTESRSFCCVVNRHISVAASLTRARPGGGGYQPPPLRFFADSEKTAAKFAITVHPTI